MSIIYGNVIVGTSGDLVELYTGILGNREISRGDHWELYRVSRADTADT